MSAAEEKCKRLVESINNRVNCIYKQLCEYEDSLDPNEIGDGDGEKIMDLLETMESIQEAAQMIRPYNLILHQRQQSLEDQVECLEKSLHIMNLEMGTKKDDSMEQ